MESSARSKWEKALTLPGHRTLEESMVAELAEFLEEDPFQVAVNCAEGDRRVAEDWTMAGLGKISAAEKINAFYRENRSYLYDLTRFNANYPYVSELESIAHLARKKGLTSILDYGAGIGSVGIYFARAGFNVTLADVSEPLQQYARWRFKKRGLNADFVNLNERVLPAGEFEVVTALDVLEHVSSPCEVLRSLARCMKVGGIFAINEVEEGDPLYPQHINSYNEIVTATRAQGFRREGVVRSFDIFGRSDRPSKLVGLYYVKDWIWYRVVRPPLITMLDRAGLMELLRKLLARKAHGC